jgi:hypothetical protein
MLKKSPDSFDALARTIANGPPPDWLVPALEYFRGFVAGKRLSDKEYQWVWKHSEEMRWAADVLIKDLQRMFGASSPDVATAIKVLTKTKNFYRERPRTGGGHRPHERRLVCAAVVVEAWKLIRGNVEPRNKAVLEACAAYWQACGQSERDAENWWRDTNRAVAEPGRVLRPYSDRDLRLLRPLLSPALGSCHRSTLSLVRD